MPIPDNDEFQNALGGMELVIGSGSDELIELCPGGMLQDESGLHQSDAVCMRYPKHAMAFSSLRLKIEKELIGRSHPSTPSIVNSVIAVFCVLDTQSIEPVTAFNSLLESIARVDVQELLVAPFPPHPEVQSFELGSFVVGPINQEKMKYWCQKVKCDFFSRYPKGWGNRFSIYRQDSEHVLDIANLKFGKAQGIVAKVVDGYFSALSRVRRDRFLDRFSQQQAIYVAAGAPYVDTGSVSAWAGAHFMQIFHPTRKGQPGYFCPLGQSITLDFARADFRFPEVIDQLHSTYGFSGITDSEIHQALDRFAQLVANARKKESIGDIEDAFIYMVVALESILNERTGLSRTVCRRVAVIASRGDAQKYASSLKMFDKLYDLRSKFVHAGHEIDADMLQDLQAVVNEVFEILMRLQSDARNHEDGFLAKWKKLLDFIAAGIEAKAQLSEADFIRAGMTLGRPANLH